MSIVLPKAVCTRTWRSRSLISFSAFSWQDSMIETHWVEGKKGPIIIPVINGQWKMSYFSKTKINHVYRIWKKAQNNSSGIVSNSPGFKFSGTFQMLFLSHSHFIFISHSFSFGGPSHCSQSHYYSGSLLILCFVFNYQVNS